MSTVTSNANDSTDERLKRESEFHDKRFADDTRSATDRFYGVARGAFDRYSDLIGRGAADQKVLEYGCGPGLAAFDLARAGAIAHGIDISPIAIEMARVAAKEKGVGDRCHFEVMNAEELRFPDHTFDRVFGSGILHHLDLDRAFREVARVLKPGGRAVFLEPLGHNPLINWYRRRTPEMRTADEHPLRAPDFDRASRYFSRVTPEFFHMAALAAVPFQSSRVFGIVQRALNLVDDVLLASRSPLRWAAWMTVVTLER